MKSHLLTEYLLCQKKDVDWIIASLSNSAFNSYHLFLSQPQQTLMQLRAWFLNKDYPLSWIAEKILSS